MRRMMSRLTTLAIWVASSPPPLPAWRTQLELPLDQVEGALGTIDEDQLPRVGTE